MKSTEILKIDPQKTDRQSIQKVVDTIKAGGIIVYPTDTIYGLGCSPFIPEAAEQIYQIKGRKAQKPLLLLVGDRSWAARVAEELPPKFARISQRFWPGPLTIVLPAREIVPSSITANTGTIGIRMPDSQFLLEILGLCDFPLVSTSANFSTGENLCSSKQIIHLFKGKVDLIVDAGDLESGLESTVIGLLKNNLQLIRQGKIPYEQIVAALEQ